MYELLAVSLPIFVILPVLIAVFLFAFSSAKYARIIAMTVQGAFILPAFLLLEATRYTEIIGIVGAYEAILGITLRADNMASVFILLTVIIFFAVGVYSIQTPFDKVNRLYLFLVYLLQGVLIGLFLTRDIFNIFVLVEVGTVVVTILLMYDRERRNLFAGMTFIIVNIVVMQFYLLGIGYLYMITGVMDMEIAANILYEMEGGIPALPYALIMTSIAAKCSLLPMITWVPKINALTGSRYTIAAIMSGLHIKSGIYLFIRFSDLFGGMANEFFLVIGILTAVMGIFMALAQTDIRLLLAYSTIAQVGLIIAGLSLDNEYSHIGSLFHIVNHAMFKVALFLCASQLRFTFKTNDITKMRGGFHHSPIISAANVMAILGIIGAPLWNGSISKYFLMYGATGALEWVFVVINLGTILVFVRYASVFFGGKVEGIKKATTDWYRLSIIIGLGLSCFVLGIFGSWTIEFLFNETISPSLWGYLEKVLIFFISLGVAVLVYTKVIRKSGFLKPLDGLTVGFHKICVSIGVFFAAILVYVGMFAGAV